MKLSIKKTLTIFCVLAIFSLFIVQSTDAHAQITTSSNASKALAFIKDVIQPNMSKYNITLVNDITGQPSNQSPTMQESIDYHLGFNWKRTRHTLHLYKQQVNCSSIKHFTNICT